MTCIESIPKPLDGGPDGVVMKLRIKGTWVAVNTDELLKIHIELELIIGSEYTIWLPTDTFRPIAEVVSGFFNWSQLIKYCRPGWSLDMFCEMVVDPLSTPNERPEKLETPPKLGFNVDATEKEPL